MSFEEWKEVRLGDVCSFVTGKLNSNAAELNGEYPFFTCSPKTLTINSFAFDQEALILAGNNAEGKFNVKYYKGKFNAYQRNYVITIKEYKSLNYQFLLYSLQLSLNLLKNLSIGTATKYLTAPIINNLKLKIPSIETQNVIARIIGSIDQKIHLNNQINQKLEEMAQAIFRSWFIDFEPFREAEFVETELGRIPKGWDAGNLTDFVQLNPKETLSKKSMATYVDMASLPTSSARINNINLREFKSGTKFRQGDVLFARITPCLENGKTAIVDFLNSEEVGWGSTEFVVLRGIETDMMEFLYFVARSKNFRSFAIKNMTGTSGRQRVSAASLGNYSIVIPPINKIKDYIELVRPFFLKMKENDKQSQTLANLRDTLLPKLMSGELRIPTEPIEEEVIV